MKHVVLYGFVLIFAGLGCTEIVANVHTPTLHVLIFSGVCLGLAALLAIPADFKVALVTLAPYLPWHKPSGGDAS